MDTVILRTTMPEDIAGVLEIERASFPSPWDIYTVMSVLKDENCFNISALHDGAVVGYSFSAIMRKMLHLLNLAVHPDFRRRGIASGLLSEMISFARSRNKSYVFLEVRESNTIAKSLYLSMGFSHAFTWRRYYSDSGEDALVMVKKL